MSLLYEHKIQSKRRIKLAKMFKLTVLNPNFSW